MTEKIRKIVAALRSECTDRATCAECPAYEYCHGEGGISLDDAAADLIEELSEALKGAHAVCETARQELEKVKRERDAAVRDLREVIENADGVPFCTYCKHQEDDGQCHHPCNSYAGESGWEWRGLPKGELHEK